MWNVEAAKFSMKSRKKLKKASVLRHSLEVMDSWIAVIARRCQSSMDILLSDLKCFLRKLHEVPI